MERQPSPPPPPGTAPGGGDAPSTPPDLAEALRTLRDSGLSGLGATGDAARALRDLVAADISLARSAAGRSATFAGVAVMFGVSAWLLLMTAVIVVLSNIVGLPWWLSLGGCGTLSAVFAWLALRKAEDYFEHTRLKATRRQLARLGLGELADLVPRAGEPGSARDAAAPPAADGDSDGGAASAGGEEPR